MTAQNSDELARAADTARARLLDTVARLDERRKGLLEVPKKVGRSMWRLGVGAATVAVVVVAALAAHGAASQGTRRRRDRWRLLKTAWSHPDPRASRRTPAIHDRGDALVAADGGDLAPRDSSTSRHACRGDERGPMAGRRENRSREGLSPEHDPAADIHAGHIGQTDVTEDHLGTGLHDGRKPERRGTDLTMGTSPWDAGWDDINGVRDRLMARAASSVEHAAQSFVEDLAQTFPSIVLARLFLVVRLRQLPSVDQARAESIAAGDPRLTGATRVLSLLGTAGSEPAWCDRTRSVSHLAIPLLSQKFVHGAPMLAKLLADLDVNLASLDDGGAFVTRDMLGGLNKSFFVPDARETRDGSARHIIAAQDFVERHGIRSVFGMGGAYFDGTLAVAIAFTSGTLDAATAGRFPSLIGNFKMASADHCQAGRIYAAKA